MPPYLHWWSAGLPAGFSAGCTDLLWVAAAAGFLSHPGRPGCFSTTTMGERACELMVEVLQHLLLLVSAGS